MWLVLAQTVVLWVTVLGAAAALGLACNPNCLGVGNKFGIGTRPSLLDQKIPAYTAPTPKAPVLQPVMQLPRPLFTATPNPAPDWAKAQAIVKPTHVDVEMARRDANGGANGDGSWGGGRFKAKLPGDEGDGGGPWRP
jgi:hypothetical protein